MKTIITQFQTAAALAIATMLSSGCVTRTTVKDEPRQQTRFSSALAAQAFYDAYLAINHPSPQKNSGRVYFPLPYHHFTVSTENVRFNAAIQSADSDHNGTISESEAANYATKTKKPLANKSAS